MVINESLVARTFGAYTLQILDLGNADFWVPTLGVTLLAIAVVGLAFVDLSNLTSGSTDGEFVVSANGFLAGVALAILASGSP